MISLEQRVRNVGELLNLLTPIPDEWIAGVKPTKASSSSATDMQLLECDSYKVLLNAWRKAMKWTDGLEHGLTCMLAVVLSTKSIGDQLWMKIIGPASCGKSTLAEALSTNKEYILAKSTIRGFHSGYKTDKDGEEDHSLIELVRGKTLVTKDGDTLLQSPNLGQILAEARDLYDTTSRTHYRHGMDRDYQGIRMTWLLYGTNALRKIDASELGERFLDCVIMEGIDSELEDEVLWRVVNKATRAVGIEADGQMETQQDPDMTLAMQLTGGYVSHLRQNGIPLLAALTVTDESKRKIMKLGKFVSFMRARPSERQQEISEREFGARLTSQFARLATCLAVVMNYRTTNEIVMERVRQVALDTARGKTLVIADYIRGRMAKNSEGVEPKALAGHINLTLNATYDILRFMRDIGIVETYWHQPVKTVSGRNLWRLTTEMDALIAEIYEEVEEETEQS